MLDDEKRDAAPVDLGDAVDDRVEKGRIDSGARLIKENEAGIGHEHAAKFQELALAAREDACRLACQPRQPQEFEMRHRPLGIGAFFDSDVMRFEPVGEEALARLRLRRGQHVFDEGHLGERSGYLKSAAKSAR